MDDNSIQSLHADNSLPSLQAVSQVNNYIQVFISYMTEKSIFYWELIRMCFLQKDEKDEFWIFTSITTHIHTK